MTTNHAGPLQTALANMDELHKISLEPYTEMPPREQMLIEALRAALTALIPASQLSINTSQRAIAADRDIGILAERLRGAERKLDTPNPDILRLSGVIDGLANRLRNLETRLEEGMIPVSHITIDTRERVTALERDLRSAEHAIGELHKQLKDERGPGMAPPAVELVGDGLAIRTLHIEHLHVGEPEPDRAPVVEFQFGQGMDTATAESIAREAARGWARTNRAAIARGEMRYLADVEDATWRPHAWVVDAITYAAGAHPDAEPPSATVDPKSINIELSQALKASNEHARALELALGGASMTWDSMIAAVAELRRDRDKLKADYAALVEINNTNHRKGVEAENARATLLGWKRRIANALNCADDMHRIEGAANRLAGRVAELERTRSERSVTVDAQAAELEGLRNQRAELNAALDRAHAQLDAERRKVTERDAEVHRWIDLKGTTQDQLDKFMGAVADQAIQIVDLRTEVTRLTEIAAAADAERVPLAMDLQGAKDRIRAADILIAAMPAWEQGAVTLGAFDYELPLLRAWKEAKKLVTPAVEAESTEPLSGL